MPRRAARAPIAIGAVVLAVLAAGAGAAQGAEPTGALEKVTLTTQTSFPMELAVAPDGRVFFVELAGAIKLYRPDTGTTSQIGSLSVDIDNENGLLGLALDPAFATTGWAYLYYAPAGVPENRLSRFTITGNTFDASSEKVLLTVPRDDTCCHQGGSIAFGPTGDLFVAVGENTEGHEIGGWPPIDERAGRAFWDAQRTAASTNDLRGKILRIRPTPAGGYTIPAGNLFVDADPLTRPEIYVMGARNPFRITVDQQTGWLYWGDVGPDATSDHPQLGPMGYDEFNQTRAPGNYGWPYCIADNKAYGDYHAYLPDGKADPASVTGFFSCAAPVNNSPNRNGLASLPPAQGAFIWYSYGHSPQDFTAIENLGSPPGGRSGFAGPVYHYDATSESTVKLPASYDNSFFIYDWERDWINEVELDSGGAITAVKPFRTGLNGPIDLEIGPDGSMYLLEMGDYTGANPSLSQIRWAAEPGTPVAKASADRTSGPLPLTVQFSSAGSTDPDGGPLSYQWDFEANGTTDSVAANPSHTYTTPGDHAARLTVTDNQGKSAVASVTVTAGNTIPTVSFSTPPDGAFYSFGDRIAYRAVVTDPEDGPVDCSRVTVRISMGHSTHFHPMATANGCEGVVQTESAGGHGPDDNLFAVLEATYTDNGATGARALTGSAIYTLHPKHKQAEYSSQHSGVSVAPTTDPGGGNQDVAGIGDGDHFAFAPVSLFNINRLSARVDAAGTAGRIEVRASSPSGRLVGTIPVAAGGWQTASANVCDPGGSSSLFLVFRGFNGSARVNWLEFGGGGVTFGGPSTLAPCGSGTAGPGGTTTDPGTSTVGKLRGFLMNKRMSLRSLRRNGLKLRVTLPRTARALKVSLFRVKGTRWRTPKRPAMSRTFKYKRGGAKRVTWRFTRRQKQRLERGRWVVQVQAGPSARRLQAPKLRKRLTVVR